MPLWMPACTLLFNNSLKQFKSCNTVISSKNLECMRWLMEREKLFNILQIRKSISPFSILLCRNTVTFPDLWCSNIRSRVPSQPYSILFLFRSLINDFTYLCSSKIFCEKKSDFFLYLFHQSHLNLIYFFASGYCYLLFPQKPYPWNRFATRTMPINISKISKIALFFFTRRTLIELNNVKNKFKNKVLKIYYLSTFSEKDVSELFFSD